VYHDLVEYIYTAHRLILEPWKSRVLPIDKFLEMELIDPSEIEHSSELRRFVN
jgi:hypothetical protein